MEILKIVAGVILFVLLLGIGWCLGHLRRIRKELVHDEALPKTGPTLNILVLISAVCFGFSALLIAYILH